MALEQALYQTTGLRSVNDASVGQLTHLATEYPYFATAQLLLAAKLKQEGKTGAFQQQLQKAALYSTNPFWLNYQLANDNTETIDVLATTTSSSTNFVEKPFIHPIFSTEIPAEITPGALELSEIDSKPLFTDINEIEQPKVNAPAIALQQPTFVAEATYSPLSDLVDVPTLPNIKEEEIALVSKPNTTSDTSVLSNIQWDPYVDVPGVVSFGSNNPISPAIETASVRTTTSSFTEITAGANPSAAIEIPTLETVKQLLGNHSTPSVQSSLACVPSTPIVNQPVIAQTTDDSFIPQPITANPSNTLRSENTALNAVTLSEEALEVENEINNTEAIAEAIIETPNIASNQNIASLLGSQAANFKKPVEADAKLEFEKEPYYTIDYFASQGIKIDLTKQPQDKLTTQLRRFTDWLKHMKKIDPNPVDLGTDPELEKAIADIAQTSLSAREIVTETMADIFVKQGKVEKAIQLFIKLSFLDPEKSAYFATKIQQLKGI